MISLLTLVLFYMVLGSMISVLVTDYLQFLVLGLGLVVTLVLVLWNVGWPNIVSGLDRAGQAGQVYTKSFEAEAQAFNTRLKDVRKQQGAEAAEKLRKAWEAKQARLLRSDAPALAEACVLVDTKNRNDPKPLAMKDPFKSFGVLWVVWQAILHIAVVTTWQTSIARVLSARDEQTAKKIYRRTSFYFVGRFALPGLWGAAAFLYFCSQGELPEGVNSLTAMPQFLGQTLPMGVIGILVAAMLAAEMSTDRGYLLTVRLMVVVIGIFLVFYGLLYELSDLAWDYLAVTGNIYLASLFTLLVGALYWRGANHWGAMAAIILGAIGPISFLVVNAVVQDPSKQISAALAGLSSFGLSFGGMIVGSLLGRAFGCKNAPITTSDSLPPEAT